MTDALASVDKSIYTSVASRKNVFYTEGSMIDDVAGFAVQNRNYEIRHQLAKPSSVFSAEISPIGMALEHIQICLRGRFLILSDSLARLWQCGQEGLHVRLILGFMRANRSTGTFSSSIMM
jgi:hypothetical protein